MKLLMLLVSISTIGCMSFSEKNIKEAYENRGTILSTFSNISVFKKGKTNNVFLYTYKGSKRNEYVFTNNQGEHSLYRDKLLFNPDLVLKVDKNKQNGMLY